VIVSWERCHCAEARAAHSERAAWGHLTVTCQVPGVPVGVVLAARARLSVPPCYPPVSSCGPGAA